MKTQSSIRIIGGKWRSRKVSFITKDALRPTPDRVRETLFNWLAPHIVGSVCLDLYAGTGVLGLEALSRGAKSNVAVDKDQENIEQININADLLEVDNLQAHSMDCLKWLQGKPFVADIVFVDPPYHSDMLQETFKLLEDNGWLQEGSLIYFELDKPIDEKILPITWKIKKHRKAGHVLYYLAEKE